MRSARIAPLAAFLAGKEGRPSSDARLIPTLLSAALGAALLVFAPTSPAATVEVGSWDEVIKAFKGTDTTIVLTQDIEIPYIDDSAFPDPDPKLGSWTIDANGMSIKSLVNDRNMSDRQPIHAIDGNTVTLQNVGTFTLKAGTRIDDPSSLPDENEGWTGSTRGFIGASKAESQIVLVNSLIQNTTLGDSSWAVHISNGAAAFIVDSLFLNLTGTVHHGSAIGLIEGEASGLWINLNFLAAATLKSSDGTFLS